MKRFLYFKERIRSFSYAFQGVRTLFSETPNARIHVVIIALVIVLGFWLHISRMEWIAVCILFGVVPATEAINSAIEKLADFACGGRIHPSIKKAKDLAAAAVLLTAIASVVAGVLIFLPKLIELFVE